MHPLLFRSRNPKESELGPPLQLYARACRLLQKEGCTNDALDTVRKGEYARLSGKDRRLIKGQKYTLLAHRENLPLEGRKSLELLLAANKR